MKHILVKADHHKVRAGFLDLFSCGLNYYQQWRHSSFGNYYVHSLDTKATYPLLPPTNPPVTAYATWSPTGDSIAFVASNDIYILPSAS